MASYLRDIEAYEMYGEKTTITMILETDTNTKATYQIGLDVLYQAYITDYIKISIDFNKTLCKSYTSIW